MATPSSAWTGEKPRKAGNGAGRGSAVRSGEKVVPISPTGSAQDVHRTPPHSVEAEQGVLGSMLISPRDTIAECVEKINELASDLPPNRQRSGGRSIASYGAKVKVTCRVQSCVSKVLPWNTTSA